MKTILVTGTSSGIGYEICVQAAKLNYKVISVSRNIEPLNEMDGIESYSIDITDLSISYCFGQPLFVSVFAY